MQHSEQKYTATSMSEVSRFVMLSLTAVAIYIAIIPSAHAIGGVLCGMIGATMGGGLARAIATVGVLMVGVGATLGKVSWTLAITIAVGIAAIFGTASIVASLSSGLGAGCFGT